MEGAVQKYIAMDLKDLKELQQCECWLGVIHMSFYHLHADVQFV